MARGRGHRGRLLNQLSSVCHFMIGNYRFALNYGCVHPGMPLCRNQFRRSRDAPMLCAATDFARRTEQTLAGLFVKELTPVWRESP
jgi:hypothetical protein